MANEAMSEERLKHIQYACESSNAKTLRANVKELLSALREAQERAGKAEEAGYRRGVEAAMEQLRMLQGSADFDDATLSFAVAILRRLPLPEPKTGGRQG